MTGKKSGFSFQSLPLAMPICGFADCFKFAIAHPAFSFYPHMAYVFSPEKRSEVMSHIRGRDTKPDFHRS